MALNTKSAIAIWLLYLPVMNACGPVLSLEPRKTLKADDLIQSYQVQVFATTSGASSFEARAMFSTNQGSNLIGTQLPAEDQVTLNGTPMATSAAADGEYVVQSTGNPGTYTFVWKHGGFSFQNTATATLYPLTAVPKVVSKSAGIDLQVASVDVGVVVSGQVNTGSIAAAPFYDLPVTVKGGGSSASVTPNLGGLTTGPGVLTILEISKNLLQASTLGGGGTTVIVQYGYSVSITD